MNIIRRSVLRLCRTLNACDKLKVPESEEKHFLIEKSAMFKDAVKMFEDRHEKAVKLIEYLKNELANLDDYRRQELISEEVEILRIENQRLKEELRLWQARVIELETRRGIQQIPLPTSVFSSIDEPTTANSVDPGQEMKLSAASEMSGNQEKEQPTKKGKKATAKKNDKADEKPQKSAAAPKPEQLVHVGRLDLRVGRIVSVEKHPDADTLYVEKIDVGEEQPRTIASGLVKFVSLEEMQNRLVVVLCNLKPVKMRGITSEGMVMCASTPDKVEVLDPPQDSVPGDRVSCEEYIGVPDSVLNPKKKIFEQVAPDLKTDGNCIATYKSVPLKVGSKGTVKSSTLAGVPIK